MSHVYGIVSDSPNVMLKTRKLCTGYLEGGEVFTTFAYGCACHALSLFIKDMIKLDGIKDVFKTTLKVAIYFKNTHIAHHLIDVERNKLDLIPKSIKTFSTTRWNGAAVMFESVRDCRIAMTNVFSNEMTRPDDQPSSLDIYVKSSKAYSVFQTVMDREYWSQLTKVTPVINLYATVLTFLESDLCPLSLVPLSFATLLKISEALLTTEQFQKAKEFLVARYSVICSDVHVLAMVLDPLVQKDRYVDITPFLKDRPVLSVANAALEADLKHAGSSSADIETASRMLALRVGGNNVYRMYAASYHPALWWDVIGYERSPLLSATAKRVLSLSCSSAAVERSFKVRSRVHCKSRVRLCNDNADMQSSVIFNSLNLKRIDDGELATKRETSVERLLLLGYNTFMNVNGGSLGSLLSSSSDMKSSASQSEDYLDIDLESDEPLRLIEVTSENLDSILSVDT